MVVGARLYSSSSAPASKEVWSVILVDYSSITSYSTILQRFLSNRARAKSRITSGDAPVSRIDHFVALVMHIHPRCKLICFIVFLKREGFRSVPPRRSLQPNPETILSGRADGFLSATSRTNTPCELPVTAMRAWPRIQSSPVPVMSSRRQI